MGLSGCVPALVAYSPAAPSRPRAAVAGNVGGGLGGYARRRFPGGGARATSDNPRSRSADLFDFYCDSGDIGWPGAFSAMAHPPAWFLIDLHTAFQHLASIVLKRFDSSISSE